MSALLDTFKQFPSLPTELRFKIWRYALAELQSVRSGSFQPGASPHANFHVDGEFRGRPLMRLTAPDNPIDNFTKTGIYFEQELNTLYRNTHFRKLIIYRETCVSWGPRCHFSLPLIVMEIEPK